ncbi:hypothetical protein ACFY2M_25020 [Streptomyces sp. NPDC001276]|uniref:hypothetical protein n=1 Tax=Streptomyces sp. NPDC001276 TaxID=3364555 RepID=UPI00367B0C7D
MAGSVRQLPATAKAVIIAALAVVIAVAIASLASGNGSQKSATQLVQQRLLKNCADLTKVNEDQGYTVQIERAYAAGTAGDGNPIVKVPVTYGVAPFTEELEAVFTVSRDDSDVIISSGDEQTFRLYTGRLGADSVVNGQPTQG